MEELFFMIELFTLKFNQYSLLYHQFCRAFSQLEVAIPLLLYVMLFYTENI